MADSPTRARSKTMMNFVAQVFDDGEAVADAGSEPEVGNDCGTPPGARTRQRRGTMAQFVNSVFDDDDGGIDEAPVEVTAPAVASPTKHTDPLSADDKQKVTDAVARARELRRQRAAKAKPAELDVGQKVMRDWQQKLFEGAAAVDTTGDGKADTLLVDTTGDGKHDSALRVQVVDATTVMLDTTGDGVVDTKLPLTAPLPTNTQISVADALEAVRKARSMRKRPDGSTSPRREAPAAEK
eukprot:TRINITY_DN35842_c0_g1_i1.p1 TRINITY_DN35842_c0_g1~~TRINITY_DN35842_c0_g1_i1.p1  ORF type:complete len:240 (+),score=83.74 TRINITY_DN35842_c0_g1_i1:58-777(+)